MESLRCRRRIILVLRLAEAYESTLDRPSHLNRRNRSLTKPPPPIICLSCNRPLSAYANNSRILRYIAACPKADDSTPWAMGATASDCVISTPAGRQKAEPREGKRRDDVPCA